MADRVVEEEVIGVPAIDETLQNLMLQMIEECIDALSEKGEFPPTTGLLNGEVVSSETFSGTTDECFEGAQRAIAGANGAAAYAFCYDGYLETDDGELDAIICEGGLPGQDEGLALALMYTIDDEGEFEFQEEVVYIGPAPNYLQFADAPVAEGAEEEDDLIG